MLALGYCHDYYRDPDSLFLMPIEKIEYPGLYLDILDRFDVELERRIKSKDLWHRLLD